ncbi:hypothetical protein WV31_15935 [Magnetospirillum sp. ME-1]|nr:hypothetical protein WV31_15935 [Magnetospirillum sp. ME-1]
MDRVDWENNELAASNRKLYSILSRCFDVYKQLAANPFLIKHVDDLLTAKDIKATATLHPANKLMKLVFGDNDRRRVSAYATVMKAALEDEKKASANFAAWVNKKKGIEAIRTGNTAESSTTAETKSADAFNKATTQLSKRHAIAKLGPCSNFPDGTGYVMVLAHIAADRSLSVVKFVGKINDDRTKSLVIKVAAEAEKADEKATDKLSDKAVNKAAAKNKAREKRAIERNKEEAENEKKNNSQAEQDRRAKLRSDWEARQVQTDAYDEPFDENLNWEVTYTADEENEEINVAA